MELTKEQQALLDGAKGPTMAKVMRTLVQYGEIFGAEKMVPVTGQYGHLVLSFGLNGLSEYASDTSLFEKDYDTLLDSIQKATPKTKIILQTVYPVAKESDH